MSRTVHRIVNIVLALGFVALLIFALNHAYAQYVYSKSGADSVVARAFYFESNYLTEDGAEYILSPGTDSVSFELQNHADALRISTDEIGYTLTVTGEGAAVNDPTGGKLTGGVISDATVTVSGLKSGVTYTVTAVGSAGYEKTLSATFTVESAATRVFKKLERSGAFVTLTVWTEDTTGTASVSFPEGLVPDATDGALAAVANYDGGTYAAGAFTDAESFTVPYASRSYRFFTDSPGAYSAAQFAVSVGTTEAVVPTPA